MEPNPSDPQKTLMYKFKCGGFYVIHRHATNLCCYLAIKASAFRLRDNHMEIQAESYWRNPASIGGSWY